MSGAGRLAVDRKDPVVDVSNRARSDGAACLRRRGTVPPDLPRRVHSNRKGRHVIRVEMPGMMTTVQDLGREGFGPIGVSASGAADPIALRIGNRLLGNAEGAAALEFALVGGTFRFEIDTWVVITGSDFGATLEETPVAPWIVQPVRKGQVLRMRSTHSGARCYLCVSGGFDVPLVLGSASTHVLSALGGFNGRPLRKGDLLQVGPCRPPAARCLNPQIG